MVLAHGRALLGGDPAPGNVYAFGDSFAVRVNRYGIDECEHQQPLVIRIHVVPGLVSQFLQPDASAELLELNGAVAGQRDRAAAQCLRRAGQQQRLPGETLAHQRVNVIL
jgi:hypothetical protein